MKTTKIISPWIPRILAISFIIFISIFALDVFELPHWPLALFMHLIPSFILIILTIIAWNNSKVGGILYLIASLLFGIFFKSTIIIVPTFVIGILLLVAKISRRGNL
jgi:hypothetical protein